ncbi:MAG: glycoside hydrolase family 25 protein [Oscillospiraceae bacterium]|nr:glycoside hydrolase family 25 protein [Oscillospiraceae bacterium]
MSTKLSVRIFSLILTLAIISAPLRISGAAPAYEPVAFPYTAKAISREPLAFKRGIDVSFWQNDIDWQQVAAAGVEFSMLRIGAGEFTTNAGELRPDRVDERFFEYIARARENGIEVGVYWYSYARTVAGIKREAQFLVQLLAEVSQEYDITYPVVLDMEEPRDYYRDNPSEMAEAFLEIVVRAGYFPMIYSFRSWLESNLSREVRDTYALWVAHWGVQTTELRGGGNYYMWQYTDSGRVSGIDGDVDLNISYRDFAAYTRRLTIDS